MVSLKNISMLSNKNILKLFFLIIFISQSFVVRSQSKTNKKIIKCKVLNSKLRWPIETRKLKVLENRTIKSVKRRGKYILIEFEPDKVILIIHLGMTGVISFANNHVYKRPKHDHFLLFFNDFIFVFNDIRKFGSIHITKDISNMFLILSKKYFK